MIGTTSLINIRKMGQQDQRLYSDATVPLPELTNISVSVQRMRQHVGIGYEMVRGIAFLSGAAQILLTHHERFDGSGYPRGLAGRQPPMGARIFSVADTLDAMTSDRPYRDALSLQAARDEIVRCSLSQFDPHVVEVFLGIPAHAWQRVQTEASLLNFVDIGKKQKF